MHVHTRDCPLACLQPLLSAAAWNLLRAECLLISHGTEPTAGHAVDLYTRRQLPTIHGIGPARLAEIQTALTSAGLTAPAAASAPPGQPGPAAHDGQALPLRRPGLIRE